MTLLSNLIPSAGRQLSKTAFTSPHSYRLDAHTLCTGVQEAVAEILALQDFLYYVISIHPSSIDSLQLVLH